MDRMKQKLSAEALGTLILVMTVVGSGIMAEQLSGGIDGLALIGNTLATGCILVVLITLFGPVSGAHFNPAVTLAFHFAKRSICYSCTWLYDQSGLRRSCGHYSGTYDV